MEDSLAVNLSSRSLEVSRVELLLQVGAFCVGVGALVSGIFGMNLRSYLEEHVVELTCLLPDYQLKLQLGKKRKLNKIGAVYIFRFLSHNVMAYALTSWTFCVLLKEYEIVSNMLQWKYSSSEH